MPLDVPRLQWRWTDSAAPKQFIAEIVYNILVYYLKQCCSIFGLKVVEKNFYATIFEWCSKILWSKKYIQMYFYYIDYNFISFVSIYTYKHLLWCFDFILYLSSYISRFGKHFKKTFWEPFCCSFELGPPYCLCNVS